LIAASQQLVIESNDLHTASRAVRVEWLIGELRDVELAWWKSKNRVIRLISAALLLTGRHEDTSDVPFLDASRFEPAERKEREEELAFFRARELAFRSAIVRLLDQTDAVNPNPYKKTLRFRIGREK
jgi:hypothetical protein